MELGSQLGPQSRQIRLFIQTQGRKLEVDLQPHFAPQRVLMGNHRMEHRHPRINTISPIVLEVVIVEIRR